MTRLFVRLPLLVTALLAAAMPGLAQRCSSINVSGIGFGGFNPIANQTLDTVGTVSVTCTGTAGQRVQLRIDTSSCGAANRAMTLGGLQIAYNVYVDAARQMIWGDGTGGTSEISDSFTLHSTSETHVYTIYGRIFGSQNTVSAGPAPHTYSDNLTVTVTMN
jgi:spore coat protein U-like protein